MNTNRVRVQLQQSTTNIESESTANITADATIKALQAIQVRGKRYVNHPEWTTTLDIAMIKAVSWVKKVKSGGGYIGRGSGTAHSERFTYGNKEFRIDIEVHGEKDPGWFK